MRGREPQRKALEDHRDADEELQRERTEYRPGAQPRVREAALAERINRGERERRGGDDGTQAMGEMDGDARGGGQQSPLIVDVRRAAGGTGRA